MATPASYYNGLIAALLRSPLHGMLSKNMMLITYQGRKSGRSITTPVNYIADGNRLLTVSLRERTWWRNFRGGAPASLRLRGKEVPAQGRVVEDPAAVAAGLGEYLQLTPQLARYFDVDLSADDESLRQALQQASANRIIIEFQIEK